jgi:superfamily II DNA or RNA helicase
MIHKSEPFFKREYALTPVLFFSTLFISDFHGSSRIMNRATNTLERQKPISLKIIISNHLRLSDIPADLYSLLIEKLKIQNPKWLENKKMGRWNRNTPKELKFYDKIGKDGLSIPRGYMRQLIYLCRSQEIPYEIEDRRLSLPEVDIRFSGHLKPFQIEAAQKMLTRDFGVLSAPTGSGKTVIALFMIAQRRQPALIVVHTKELAYQWIDRIHSFLDIPLDEIGLIGNGKMVIGEKITVALVQSLYKCSQDVSPKIGYLVVDESHRCPSRTFTDAVTDFTSRYMLGLSATPFRRDKLSQLIFWHLGDLHHQIEKEGLIQQGHILEADVTFRETSFKSHFDPIHQYTKMLSELTEDKDRNLLIASDIANEIKQMSGVCLVLSDRKAHCKNLQAILKYRYKTESTVLTGDTPAPERKEVLEQLHTGGIRILIATGQLIGEGFDCKELSTLFLATPIKFSGRLLQYIGRVMRIAPGKKKAKIVDYIDVNVDVLNAAARSRQRIYNSG